jgi:hypothetical protein
VKYYKIGGLHWLTIGRLRLMWCIANPKPELPRATTLDELIEPTSPKPRTLTTWTTDENNRFIF